MKHVLIGAFWIGLALWAVAALTACESTRALSSPIAYAKAKKIKSSRTFYTDAHRVTVVCHE